MGLLLASLSAQADVFTRDDINLDPLPQSLTICHGNGCRYLSPVALTPEQWESVREAFLPIAETAQAERLNLQKAIAQMEVFVGKMTGTTKDKGGTFNGGDGQMDCIDESTNTSLYLSMFQKFGLMRHHRVVDRVTRGWFLGAWPHTTAVIEESDPGSAGQRWAVDSWFHDNGRAPEILPLETWRAGWEPQ